MKLRHSSMAFKFIWPFILAYAFLIALVQDQVFFWDTVQLGSKQAHFFYENGFFSWLLPNEIDSGHIPFFGFYLALIWKVFGKSLFISHWAMFPFLVGIAWQVQALLGKHLSKTVLPFALILVLCDPTLLAQSALISPDIVLIFFFLLGINAALNHQRTFLMVAYLGLVLISMRGMMLCAALFFWTVFLGISAKKGSWVPYLVRKGLILIPAVGLFLIFAWYHYNAKGWIAYHEDSPWAESFTWVGFKSASYNLGLVTWRMLDFGRCFFYLIAGMFTFYLWRKNDLHIPSISRKFLILFALVGFFTIPNLVLHAQLTAHRYLLPLILLLSLIIILNLFSSPLKLKWKRVFFLLTLLSLLGGNFWIYPKHIAQGWDSSLAYLPYHSLRGKMLKDIQSKGLNRAQICTSFPDLSKEKFYSLRDSEVQFKKGKITDCAYWFWSNIHNDISDEELNYLDSHGKELSNFHLRGVRMKLYELRTHK